MARSNSGNTANRLGAADSPITALPCTISCWFNPTNLTTNSNLVFLRLNTGASSPYIGLIYDGANSNGAGDNVVIATTGNVGTEVLAASSAGGTAGQWMHCAGVFTSVTSRTPYRDGAAGTTNTTTNTASSFAGGTDVGHITVGGSTFSPMTGAIAEVAVWDVALTAAEVASLAKGTSPLLIRPANLVRYWPLGGRFSPEPDLVSTTSLTVTGTVAQAAHPPVKRPQDAQAPVPDAGGGTPATATGATVTEQGSLVTGSATGAASGATATITLATSVIAGAATGAASAAAATVTEQASLSTVGAATGAASRAAATVTLNASLIAGAATGAATAATVTVTEATALIAGAATGAATVAAATVTEAGSLVAGSATGAASAPAPTISLNTSLIAGAGSGAASVVGATVSEAASLIAGSVSAGGVGNASGVTISLVASLIAGTATGATGTTAAGATVSETTALIGGAATGAAAGAAATVSEATSLLAGTAVSGSGGAQSAVAPPVRASFDQTGVFWDATSTTFDAESTRVFPAARVSLIPGAAEVNRTGQGVTLTATVSLIPGTAVADSAPVAAGATFTTVTTLLAGAASSAEPAMVSGTTFTVAASLIAGAATGAVTTSSAITWDQTSPTWDTTSVTFDQTTGAGAGAGAGSFIGQPTYSFIAGTAIGASSAAGVTFETRAFFMASPANVLDAPGTAQGATVTAVLSLVTGRARGQGWRKHPHEGPPWTNVDKPSGEWTVVAKPGGAWDRAA